MLKNLITLTILLSCFNLFAQIKISNFICFTPDQAWEIKAKEYQLIEITNTQDEIIRSQDKEINIMINLTNDYELFLKNKIDFSDTIIERSKAIQEILKFERRAALKKGIIIGAGSGIVLAILAVIAVNNIDFNNNMEVAPGGPKLAVARFLSIGIGVNTMRPLKVPNSPQN